jgi:hypothetical protein
MRQSVSRTERGFVFPKTATSYVLAGKSAARSRFDREQKAYDEIIIGVDLAQGVRESIPESY